MAIIPEGDPGAAQVDPKDFLRALLRINPEDAAKARAQAAEKAGQPERDARRDEAPHGEMGK